LTVDAMMGSVKITAIIDTGGQATIGNQARVALSQTSQKPPSIDTIVGATLRTAGRRLQPRPF
jgi:hypothetical protein